MEGRLSRENLEILRRSAAMSGNLPSEELRWLLAETDRLLQERERLSYLTAELRVPWRELRATLMELHHLASGDT